MWQVRKHWQPAAPQLTLRGVGEEGAHSISYPITGHGQPYAGDKNDFPAAPSVLILNIQTLRHYELRVQFMCHLLSSKDFWAYSLIIKWEDNK